VTVESFRQRRFRESSLRLITALRDIASDYAAAGMKLTVRQLYYQCVARDSIENNEREYQKIIRLLTDAREAGLFDWDAIEDRGLIPLGPGLLIVYQRTTDNMTVIQLLSNSPAPCYQSG
jgi:hypothetical protein